MNPLLRVPRLAFVLSLSSAGVASAAEGDYLVQTLGDTSVEVLDDDTFEATSAANKPTVAVQQVTGRITAVPVDPSDAVPGGLGVKIDVYDGSFLAETGEVSFAKSNFFNGRLLTSKDLTREQAYRPSASFGGPVDYALFNGGVFVGLVESADGVAPFVLAGLPDAFEAEPDEFGIRASAFGGTTVLMDSGASVTVDAIGIYEHEWGHGMDTNGVRMTVSASGVSGLVLDVEAEGELAGVERLVLDQAAFDVSGDVRVELGAGSTLATVTARFQPVAGMQHRVFLRQVGVAASGGVANPPWGLDRIDQRMAVPAVGQELVYEYVHEVRQSSGGSYVWRSGYIRIKKLNSGG